jgi:putative ATPase
LRLSGGDGRLLNIFELVINASADSEIITNERFLTGTAKHSLYDKSGEQHYDIVSAIDRSDPNGAVYCFQNDEGGEDVKFIARRMLILSSEDIGNANPTAL